MSYHFDKAFGNYLPDEDEPIYVCKCEHCHADIFEGDDIYEDSDGQIFCSSDCVVEYFTTSKTAEVEEPDFE